MLAKVAGVDGVGTEELLDEAAGRCERLGERVVEALAVVDVEGQAGDGEALHDLVVELEPEAPAFVLEAADGLDEVPEALDLRLLVVRHGTSEDIRRVDGRRL
jgi:hypothetical protein